MKYTTLISLLLVVLASSSCKKNAYSNNNNNNTPATDSGYLVNGIADFTMKQDDIHSMPISITHVSGEQQQVTISNSSLPDGMYLLFEPQKGTPSFTSVVTVGTTYKTPAGNHTIKLVTVGSKSSVKKEFPFNVTVEKQLCSEKIAARKFNVSNDCNNNWSLGNTLLYANGDTLLFSNFPNAYKSNNTYTLVDCLNDKIDIPVQRLNSGDSIKGSGYYSNNDIVLNITYKLINSSSWKPCTFHFVKK